MGWALTPLRKLTKAYTCLVELNLVSLGHEVMNITKYSELCLNLAEEIVN